MTTHINNRSTAPLIWIAGIAITLFSLVGIAAFMGWIPNSIGNPGDSNTLSATDDKTTPHNNTSAAKARKTPTRSHVATETHRTPTRVASNTVSKPSCPDCGVIQSTRVIAERGDGGAVGIVGGAVVGGLLGNQVGGGRGKDIATVAGAVGGAVAGNEIQKRVETNKRYEMVVRFEDGSTRVYSETKPNGWQTGDRVRVVNGVIRPNS